MATPITASIFRSIVEKQLSEIFEDVYEQHGWGILEVTDKHEIEVDFNGQD